MELLLHTFDQLKEKLANTLTILRPAEVFEDKINKRCLIDNLAANKSKTFGGKLLDVIRLARREERNEELVNILNVFHQESTKILVEKGQSGESPFYYLGFFSLKKFNQLLEEGWEMWVEIRLKILCSSSNQSVLTINYLYLKF